jgi:GT2 family glycosyltransferase
MTESPIRLTTVVVCRNEERNVARCLRSLLSATRLVEGASEVVVVDSASTDATVETALAFPVRVVELGESWPLSPAAGRFHGSLAARGEFVFFVDGDMAVDPSWLPRALAALAKDPRLAGVTGIERQIYVEGGAHVGGRENPYGFPAREAPARVLPGAAVFRRSALEAVGSFDPFLASEEEAELCYRLAKAGFSLASLPAPMVEHVSAPRRSLAEMRRRVRGRLYRGVGQVLRRSLSTGLFLDHASRLRVFVAFALFLAFGLLALLAWLLAGAALPLLAWCVALAALAALLAIRKRSLREAALSIAILAVIAVEAARGFLAPLPAPEMYPRDVRVREGRRAAGAPDA